MTSWIRMWPLLLIPFVVMVSVGLLPTITFFNKPMGGPFVREWLLNAICLPMLPQAQAWQLIDWFAQATLFQEIGLHVLIMLNLYAFLFPCLFVIGSVMIRYSVWSRATELRSINHRLKR